MVLQDAISHFTTRQGGANYDVRSNRAWNTVHITKALATLPIQGGGYASSQVLCLYGIAYYLNAKDRYHRPWQPSPGSCIGRGSTLQGDSVMMHITLRQLQRFCAASLAVLCVALAWQVVISL